MQRLRAVDVDDPRNDARSFGDWLRAHRPGTRAAIESIWELIARPTLNLTVDDASLAQAAQVFQLGLLQERRRRHRLGGRPLVEIHDRGRAAGARARRRRCAAAQHRAGDRLESR